MPGEFPSTMADDSFINNAMIDLRIELIDSCSIHPVEPPIPNRSQPKNVTVPVALSINRKNESWTANKRVQVCWPVSERWMWCDSFFFFCCSCSRKHNCSDWKVQNNSIICTIAFITFDSILNRVFAVTSLGLGDNDEKRSNDTARQSHFRLNESELDI